MPSQLPTEDQNGAQSGPLALQWTGQPFASPRFLRSSGRISGCPYPVQCSIARNSGDPFLSAVEGGLGIHRAAQGLLSGHVSLRACPPPPPLANELDQQVGRIKDRAWDTGFACRPSYSLLVGLERGTTCPMRVAQFQSKGWGKIGLRPRGVTDVHFPNPPPPLLARRDGAVTTGIHSPPVPPPYPQRWWYLCPVYSGCIP